jgi:hypothetical protein
VSKENSMQTGVVPLYRNFSELLLVMPITQIASATILTYNELDHSLPACLRPGINQLQILLPLRGWKKDRVGYLDRISYSSDRSL